MTSASSTKPNENRKVSNYKNIDVSPIRGCDNPARAFHKPKNDDTLIRLMEDLENFT